MSIELLVQLPAELQAFYAETGYLPTTAVENRTNARLRVRCNSEIQFEAPPPVIASEPGIREIRTGRVLIKDLSRTGIGVLYHEQIFPEERFRICIQGRCINATTVRCRRLNEMCYEIGGRVDSIVHTEDSDSDEAS